MSRRDVCPHGLTLSLLLTKPNKSGCCRQGRPIVPSVASGVSGLREQFYLEVCVGLFELNRERLPAAFIGNIINEQLCGHTQLCPGRKFPFFASLKTS